MHFTSGLSSFATKKIALWPDFVCFLATRNYTYAECNKSSLETKQANNTLLTPARVERRSEVGSPSGALQLVEGSA